MFLVNIDKLVEILHFELKLHWIWCLIIQNKFWDQNYLFWRNLCLLLFLIALFVLHLIKQHSFHLHNYRNFVFLFVFYVKSFKFLTVYHVLKTYLGFDIFFLDIFEEKLCFFNIFWEKAEIKLRDIKKVGPVLYFGFYQEIDFAFVFHKGVTIDEIFILIDVVLISSYFKPKIILSLRIYAIYFGDFSWLVLEFMLIYHKRGFTEL